MKGTSSQSEGSARQRASVLVIVLGLGFVLVWALVGSSPGTGKAQVSAQAGVLKPTTGQDFQDVASGNPFYAFIHNIYQDSIVTGYPCSPGGSTDPCVPPNNLPYYHPASSVTRSQMAKFIDNGRRNIADAVGKSLYINTTASRAVHALTTSGGEAVRAECLQASNMCYAVQGIAPAGDYAGYFTGGKGVYAESDDSAPALDTHATAPNTYAVSAISDAGRGMYIKSPSTSYGLYVDDAGSSFGAAIYGNTGIQGNLTVTGSKSGYVVDAMQNVDSVALEPGDVVTIVGNGPPVLGKIPVVTVKKATTAYDTGVAGVVDQVLYVPDAATKAAYQAQQDQLGQAQAERDQADKVARAQGTKPDYSRIVVPNITVTDAQGSVHAIEGATEVASGGYANVVTLGSYEDVKVDASFGAIHAGDLLTSSPHAGYAMKATDKLASMGAIIGKALADLPSSTDTIPVLITLK